MRRRSSESVASRVRSPKQGKQPVVYDPTLKQRGATAFIPEKLGQPDAVVEVRIGPSALKGNDEHLSVTLRTPVVGHAAFFRVSVQG